MKLHFKNSNMFSKTQEQKNKFKIQKEYSNKQSENILELKWTNIKKDTF